jgi:hypothetical protein
MRAQFGHSEVFIEFDATGPKALQPRICIVKPGGDETISTELSLTDLVEGMQACTDLIHSVWREREIPGPVPAEIVMVERSLSSLWHWLRENSWK